MHHTDMSIANLYWYFNKNGRLVTVLNDFDIHNPGDFTVLENGKVVDNFNCLVKNWYKQDEAQE